MEKKKKLNKTNIRIIFVAAEIRVVFRYPVQKWC